MSASENQPERENPQAPAVGVKTKPKPPALLPRYRVLLHNDDVNAFEDVIEWIAQLTPLTHSRASEVAIEAHMRGVSMVLITHLELAELYQDHLRSKLLTVTIEAAD